MSDTPTKQSNFPATVLGKRGIRKEMPAPEDGGNQPPDQLGNGQNDDKKEAVTGNIDISMSGTDQEQSADASSQATASKPSQDETEVNRINRKKHDTISRVLKCDEKDYYGILGLDKSCKQNEIPGAYKKLGLLTHPDKNRAYPEAEKAFKKIGKAYSVLGDKSARKQYDKDRDAYQAPEDIDATNQWNEEFADNAFSDDADSLSSDEQEDFDNGTDAKPDNLTLRVYKSATPLVTKYLSGQKEVADDIEIARLNESLKKNNRSRKLPEDRFLINSNVLTAISVELTHLFATARKSNGNLDRHKLSALEEQLKKIKRSYAYPEEWALVIPKDIEEMRSANGGGNSPSMTDSGTGSVPMKPPNTKPESPQDSQDTTSLSTLLSQQVSKVQRETEAIWKKMKWSTMKTSEGDIILAYKALSRGGNDPYGYEFVVMTTSSPYFETKTGSEIGRRNRDEFLAMPSTYKINTDPGDPKTPRYSYRDKENYDRLLFAATKPRKLAKAGGVPRTGETQCCVMWKDGTVAIMARNYFKKIADEDERSAIAAFCESLDTSPPWDRDPKALPVPTDTPLGQELLRAGRSGSFLSINSLSSSKFDLIPASNSSVQDDATITSLQGSVSSVKASLQAMETRFDTQMSAIMKLVSTQQEELRLQREESTKINAGLMQALSRLNLNS